MNVKETCNALENVTNDCIKATKEKGGSKTISKIDLCSYNDHIYMIINCMFLESFPLNAKLQNCRIKLEQDSNSDDDLKIEEGDSPYLKTVLKIKNASKPKLNTSIWIPSEKLKEILKISKKNTSSKVIIVFIENLCYIYNLKNNSIIDKFKIEGGNRDTCIAYNFWIFKSLMQKLKKNFNKKNYPVICLEKSNFTMLNINYCADVTARVLPLNYNKKELLQLINNW